MSKFVFILAFLLTVAVVAKASVAPTFCFVDKAGVLICVDDIDTEGPA